ncbi:MAG: AraC family transcriptional regulator [Cytophagaceae bacterium]|jgi:AraC-like DNA-binding protein|nr:AraC family transcriptional regulator [Cytophagaceae bacterium]
MEDYNKIIESLGVRFIKSKSIKIIHSLTVDNYYDVSNTILLLHKGEITFGEERSKVKEGDLLFIPGGKSASVTYGGGNTVKLTNEELLTNREKFLSSVVDPALIGTDPSSFSYVSFEAKVFDSVNFFASLDISPFVISHNPIISSYILDTVSEDLKAEPGRDRVINLNTDRIVVEIIRYILRQNLFVEKLATNSTYFKDPRLLDIFAYIKQNISGDLSNKVLAGVANVSEDYVGQYFKMLTGINPQDYIEYQRMEKAVDLLRTSKKSIREIGTDVGYKDTAYFCRRFKMMFGIPAGKMRRRESLMNI